jgi:hypothetical protein
MAHHANGLICPRVFVLKNIIELMKKGSDLVMNWMECVATSVIVPRLISLFEDTSDPYGMEIFLMEDIVELPKRNRSFLLRTLSRWLYSQP